MCYLAIKLGKYSTIDDHNVSTGLVCEKIWLTVHNQISYETLYYTYIDRLKPMWVLKKCYTFAHSVKI